MQCYCYLGYTAIRYLYLSNIICLMQIIPIIQQHHTTTNICGASEKVKSEQLGESKQCDMWSCYLLRYCWWSLLLVV